MKLSWLLPSRQHLAKWIEESSMFVMIALARLYLFPDTEFEYKWRNDVWSNLNCTQRWGKKLPPPDFTYEASFKKYEHMANYILACTITGMPTFEPIENYNKEGYLAVASSYFAWLANKLSNQLSVSREEVYEELDSLRL